MIKTINLTKKYNDFVALDDVNLHVKKGAIYGLVGPNGSGKTTLIKTLTGIYRPNKGDVIIHDKPIYENPTVKEKVVYIPDDLYFFPHARLKDMARFYSESYPTFDWERYEKIKEALHLDPHQKLSTYSKGMKRQAEFCLSISTKADIMILDEPVDGLDPMMRHQIWSLLLQDVASREMTVLISSHNLRELEDICNYVGILHKGKLIEQKNVDDFKNTLCKVQVAFNKDVDLSDIEIIKKDQLGKVQNLIIKGDRQKIEEKIKLHQPVLLEFIPLSLEEIFLYEVGGKGYEIENIIL